MILIDCIDEEDCLVTRNAPIVEDCHPRLINEVLQFDQLFLEDILHGEC
jgi:hypothetical protein